MKIERDIINIFRRWKESDDRKPMLLDAAVRKRHMTVPVGKVKIVRMQPLSFREFLRADDPKTFSFVEEFKNLNHLPEIILNKLKTENEWKSFIEHR